jgi:hypothetical protein
MPNIAVVDWEFAGIGRGLNGDLMQLMGEFSMMECAANMYADIMRGQQLRILMSTLSKAYRQVSVAEGSYWTAGAGPPDADEFSLLEPNTPRTRILRSAFLTYGAEIVRWSFVKPWKCRNPGCMVGRQHTIVKHECAMIYEMVKRALWYLRHAKDNEKDFCSLENQLVLQRARRDGRWLLDFF